MKYTAEYLADHDIYTAMVIYQNGDYDYFDGIDAGVLPYLEAVADGAETYGANGTDVDLDEYCVLVYPMHSDNTPREDMTLCPVEMFLDVLNSGNKVKFNVQSPF